MPENFKINTDLSQYFSQMRQAVEATNALRKSMLKLRLQARALDQALGRIPKITKSAARGVQTLGTAANRSSVGIRRFKKATDGVEKSVKKARKSFIPFGKAASAFLLYSAASRALGSFTQAASEAAAASLEFSKNIASIQTIDAQGLPFKRWSADLREISDAWGLDLVDQAKAAYQSLSNQVVSGAEAFEFLNQANQLARTGLSTTEDAVKVLSSAINAYGMAAGDANEISAKLFKTVELGRLRISDISSTLGRVAAPAGQLGISLDELGGSLATLTRQGIRPNEAMTQLNAIMLKLLKPTDDMKALIQELGFESTATAVRASGGLIPFLKELDNFTKGSPEAIAKLASRSRAIRGLLTLTSQIPQLEANIKALGTSQDTYGARTAVVANNTAVAWERATTQIKNIFSQDMMAPFMEDLARLTDNFGDLTEAVKFLATAWKATAPVVYLWNAAVWSATSASDALGDSIAETASDSNLWAGRFTTAAKEVDAAFKESTESIEDSLLRQIKAVNTNAIRLTEDTISAFGDLEPQLKGVFKGIVDGYKGAISDLDKENTRLASSIKSLSEELSDIDSTLEQDLLDLSLDKADDLAAKFDIIGQRIKLLEAEASRGFATDDQRIANAEERRRLLLKQEGLEAQINEAQKRADKQRADLRNKQAKLDAKNALQLKKFEDDRAKALRANSQVAEKLRDLEKDKVSWEAEYAKAQADLKAEFEDIEDIGSRRVAAEEKLIKLAQQQKALVKERLAAENAAMEATEARRKQLAMEADIFNDLLTRTDLTRGGLRDLFSTKDPKALRDGIEDIIDLISRYEEATGKLGLDDSSLKPFMEARKKLTADLPVLEQAAQTRQAVEAQREATRDMQQRRAELARQRDQTNAQVQALNKAAEAVLTTLPKLISAERPRRRSGVLLNYNDTVAHLERGRELFGMDPRSVFGDRLGDEDARINRSGIARTYLNVLEVVKKIFKTGTSEANTGLLLSDMKSLRQQLADPRSVDDKQLRSEIVQADDLLKSMITAIEALPSDSEDLRSTADEYAKAIEDVDTSIRESVEAQESYLGASALNRESVEASIEPLLRFGNAVRQVALEAQRFQGVAAANPARVAPVSGGTSNSFGDIKINAPVTSNGVDVKGLARELKRLTERQGTR